MLYPQVNYDDNMIMVFFFFSLRLPCYTNMPVGPVMLFCFSVPNRSHFIILAFLDP